MRRGGAELERRKGDHHELTLFAKIFFSPTPDGDEGRQFLTHLNDILIVVPISASLLPIALSNAVTHIITLDGAKHRSETKFGRVGGVWGRLLS